MHHSGSFTTSITNSTFSAPSSALRYGTSAILHVRLRLGGVGDQVVVAPPFVKVLLAHVERPQAQLEHEAVLRRERRERLEVVGVRSRCRRRRTTASRSHRRAYRRAEFAPAAAIAPNAPSKKEALYAEPISGRYIIPDSTETDLHLSKPPPIPRNISAEPEGIRRGGGGETSGPRTEGVAKRISTTSLRCRTSRHSQQPAAALHSSECRHWRHSPPAADLAAASECMLPSGTTGIVAAQALFFLLGGIRDNFMEGKTVMPDEDSSRGGTTRSSATARTSRRA